MYMLFFCFGSIIFDRLNSMKDQHCNVIQFAYEVVTARTTNFSIYSYLQAITDYHYVISFTKPGVMVTLGSESHNNHHMRACYSIH